MTDSTDKTITYDHLLIVEDGEIRLNELFHSARELQKYFVDGMRDGSLDLGLDQAEIADVIREAEEEAAAADHTEGTNPPAHGDPENCIDALIDLLGTHDVAVYINQVLAPVREEKP